MEELIFFIARYMIQALISQGGRYRDAQSGPWKPLISVIHWGGCGGVRWSTGCGRQRNSLQALPFIADCSLSLAVWATSPWHLYDTLSTWCRLQLKRSVFSVRMGRACECEHACVCVCVLYVSMAAWSMLSKCCNMCKYVCGRADSVLAPKGCRAEKNKLSLTHFSPSWLQIGALLMSCYWKVGVLS